MSPLPFQNFFSTSYILFSKFYFHQTQNKTQTKKNNLKIQTKISTHLEMNSNNNNTPNNRRPRRDRQAPPRYGFDEFQNPAINSSSAAFAIYRRQPSSVGQVFWSCVLSVCRWFHAFFGDPSQDPYADPNSVHIQVRPSRLCGFQELGLFVVGPRNGILPAGSIIPFRGIFVRRNSPWHKWSYWHCTARHTTKFVFIPDPRQPLPTILEFGTQRIIPYANYSNAPWRSWQGPLPRTALHHHLLKSPNARVVCSYRRDVCILRTTRPLPVGSEILNSYRWSVSYYSFPPHCSPLSFYRYDPNHPYASYGHETPFWLLNPLERRQWTAQYCTPEELTLWCDSSYFCPPWHPCSANPEPPLPTSFDRYRPRDYRPPVTAIHYLATSYSTPPARTTSTGLIPTAPPPAPVSIPDPTLHMSLNTQAHVDPDTDGEDNVPSDYALDWGDPNLGWTLASTQWPPAASSQAPPTPVHVDEDIFGDSPSPEPVAPNSEPADDDDDDDEPPPLTLDSSSSDSEPDEEDPPTSAPKRRRLFHSPPPQ